MSHAVRGELNLRQQSRDRSRLPLIAGFLTRNFDADEAKSPGINRAVQAALD